MNSAAAGRSVDRVAILSFLNLVRWVDRTIKECGNPDDDDNKPSQEDGRQVIELIASFYARRFFSLVKEEEVSFYPGKPYYLECHSQTD